MVMTMGAFRGHTIPQGIINALVRGIPAPQRQSVMVLPQARADREAITELAQKTAMEMMTH